MKLASIAEMPLIFCKDRIIYGDNKMFFMGKGKMQSGEIKKEPTAF